MWSEFEYNYVLRQLISFFIWLATNYYEHHLCCKLKRILGKTFSMNTPKTKPSSIVDYSGFSTLFGWFFGPMTLVANAPYPATHHHQSSHENIKIQHFVRPFVKGKIVQSNSKIVSIGSQYNTCTVRDRAWKHRMATDHQFRDHWGSVFMNPIYILQSKWYNTCKSVTHFNCQL